MTRSNELAVTFLAVLAILVSAPAQRASGAEKQEECAAPVCSPIQLESGWFKESNGECVADIDAALNDLRSSIEAQKKQFEGKTAADFVAQSKASRPGTGLEFDVCLGPVIIKDTCDVGCTDCMCCIWCWNYHYCWSKPDQGGGVALSHGARK